MPPLGMASSAAKADTGLEMDMKEIADWQDASAIEWAMRVIAVDEVEQISHSGWAATYRLSGPDGVGYLKTVPYNQRSQLARFQAIANRLGDRVPRVLAIEPLSGWILTADHGGRDLDSSDEDDSEMLIVLREFAGIQAQVADSLDFLSGFDAVDTARTISDLLAFLDAARDASDDSQVDVGVAYFVGEADARRYSRLLGARSGLLENLVRESSALPVTLAHGDLQRWNASLRSDGRAVFMDWDEVSVGPAGMCLHGVLGGCATANVLLARMADSRPLGEAPVARRLEAYLTALVESGYAPRDVLLRALGGAMCVGQARFIASFGRYPGGGQREASARTLRNRLSDLLDLADWLASRHTDDALRYADDYEDGQEWVRARNLIQDQLARDSQDSALLERYGRLSVLIGDIAAAEEAYRDLASTSPADPAARVALARLALGRADVAEASFEVRKALEIDASCDSARQIRARVEMFSALEQAARSPDAIPRIALSESERESGHLEPDKQAMIARMFGEYGVVQIDGLFSAERIKRMEKSFLRQYCDYFEDVDYSDALKVGDKRYMLTMALDDDFGAEDFVSSPLVMPVIRQLLGDECILSAYTAVVSQPGSDDQPLHKDHSALFEEIGWPLEHPAFAAQVIVPLIPLDAVTGATRVIKGSQRVPLYETDSLPHQDPVVPLGSCLLIDYAVSHYGIGNRSERIRPILNLVYSRPWFRDCRNYHKQPPLRFSPEYLDAAPEQVRKLVNWWVLEKSAAVR